MSSSSDLNDLISMYYHKAEKQTNRANFFRILIFASGFLSVFLSVVPTWVPIVIFVLAILSEVFAFLSDSNRTKAEDLKRIHEICDGFGEKPSESLLADILVSQKEDLKKQFPNDLLKGLEFESERDVGPRRAVENTWESSWFSNQLAKETRNILAVIIAIAVLASIVVLWISLETINNGLVASTIGKVVSSSLLLFVSLGFIKQLLGFDSFHFDASKTGRACETLLKQKDISKEDALKVLHEYQIARVLSPMIPSWLWRKRRAKIDQMWKRKKMDFQ